MQAPKFQCLLHRPKQELPKKVSCLQVLVDGDNDVGVANVDNDSDGYDVDDVDNNSDVFERVQDNPVDLHGNNMNPLSS